MFPEQLPCVEDGLERILQPWEERPFQLVSWLDMLHFSATAFFWCGSVFRSIRADCAMGSAGVVNGEPVYIVAKDLDNNARQKAISALTSVEPEFQRIGLAITAETIKELREELKTGSRHSFQWLMDKAESVEQLALKELKGKMFLYVSPERAKFWPTYKEPLAFGEDVEKKFPSASFDIHSAAIGVAITFSTGAVFHLMRVLEVGLTVLGKEFGVSLAHTNWAPAIEEIESKIRDMHKDPTWKALPDCKERQEFYAQAASHFGILKDAWRNYTMHSRGKYTEDEAERIFENVKGFMQQLAERLHE